MENIKVQIKLLRGNESIAAFFVPKRFQSSFLLSFVKLTLITLISALIVDRRPFVSQQVTLMEAALESKKAKIEGKHST